VGLKFSITLSISLFPQTDQHSLHQSQETQLTEVALPPLEYGILFVENRQTCSQCCWNDRTSWW
jgi:hypothetical protein